MIFGSGLVAEEVQLLGGPGVLSGMGRTDTQASYTGTGRQGCRGLERTEVIFTFEE